MNRRAVLACGHPSLLEPRRLQTEPLALILWTGNQRGAGDKRFGLPSPGAAQDIVYGQKLSSPEMHVRNEVLPPKL